MDGKHLQGLKFKGHFGYPMLLLLYLFIYPSNYVFIFQDPFMLNYH